MVELLHKFESLFAKPMGLPPPRSRCHRIGLLPDTAPVAVHPYRYAHAQKNELEWQCDDMLHQGVIRHSSSAFSVPVLLVKKAYRALNALTVKDKFPIPVVEELFDELCRQRQGLPRAKFILVFFDDILIYNPSWTEHLRHVRLVLAALQAHRLFLKRAKCAFRIKEVAYLNHVKSAAGMSMDKHNVRVVLDWPLPKSARTVRMFLSLAGYYRCFIHDYGSIAVPFA
jgi:hypothetical protein